MARRTKDWDQGLAEDLRNPEFAKAFIVSLIEDEGMNIKEALAKAIRAYGIKEFAAIANIPESNIVRAISPDHNPTHKTIAELLKPFRLKVSVTDDEVA